MLVPERRRVKWISTTIEDPHLGRVRVTHWAKHDPLQILEAVKSPPILSPREGRRLPDPPISVHLMPVHPIRQNLAVRHIPMGRYGSLGRNLQSSTYFNFLRRTAEAKHALLEMPVALVRRLEPKSDEAIEDYVITFWKKGTRPFSQYLRENISAKEKLDACSAIMRALAKLHATGLQHGHLANLTSFTFNIVVNKRNQPKLVDWTFLNKLVRNKFNTARIGEAKDVADELASAYFTSTQTRERGTINRLVITKKLIDEYNAQYKKM